MACQRRGWLERSLSGSGTVGWVAMRRAGWGGGAEGEVVLDQEAGQGLVVGREDQLIDETSGVESLFGDVHLLAATVQIGWGVVGQEERVGGDLFGDGLPEEAVAGEVHVRFGIDGVGVDEEGEMMVGGWRL